MRGWVLVGLFPMLACQGEAEPLMSPQDGDPVGQACGAPSNTPATLALPTKLVSVQGTVTGNVTSLAFVSRRTGAQYNAGVVDGGFSISLPSGHYHTTLWHRGREFSNSAPGLVFEVPADGASFTHLPCANASCAIPAPEPTSRPELPEGWPTGRLTGTFTFPVPVAPGGLVGHIELLPAEPDGAGYSGTGLDSDRTFSFEAVPYGRYRVAFDSQVGDRIGPPEAPGEPSLPVGRWIAPDILTIDAPETSWHGAITTTVPVHIDVLINGAPLADNGAGSDSRGNLVILRPDGAWREFLSLGATGPSTFDLMMIPGEYVLELASYTAVGHGVLAPRDQDVLPTGGISLGALHIDGATTSQQTFSFDLGVRAVRFASPATSRSSLDLKGRNGAYAWMDLNRPSSLAWSGCHAVTEGTDEGPTTSGFGPIYGDSLGEACVPCAP